LLLLAATVGFSLGIGLRFRSPVFLRLALAFRIFSR
jgi:hypothetical protein